MEPMTLVSRVVGSAVIASGRPVAALFTAQTVAAAAVHFNAAVLPDALAWTVSPIALGIGAVALGVELLIQHTEGADEFLRDLHADKLVGALVGIPSMAVLLLLTQVTDTAQQTVIDTMVSQGIPIEQATQLVDAAAERMVDETEGRLGAAPLTSTMSAGTTEVADTIKMLENEHASPAEKGALFGVAVFLQGLLTWVRGRARETFDHLDMPTIWTWFETGGVGVGVVLLMFAPTVMLVLAILVVILMLASLGVIHVAERHLDRRNRKACPSCSEMVRKEALRCKSCGTALEPEKRLGTTLSGRLRRLTTRTA